MSTIEGKKKIVVSFDGQGEKTVGSGAIQKDDGDAVFKGEQLEDEESEARFEGILHQDYLQRYYDFDGKQQKEDGEEKDK